MEPLVATSATPITVLVPLDSQVGGKKREIVSVLMAKFLNT